MKKEILKNIGIYAGILLLFIALAYGFTPQVLDGKIVNQSDIASWKGMANEAITYNKANPDDKTAWTNSMFGGMPTTATIDAFEGDWTDVIYDFLLTGKRPASYLLIALMGGFLLMLSVGTSRLVAIAGAIAIAFCSYNMQIIQVGHNTKMQALAYFPWVLAGVIYTYKAALKTTGWKTWLPKTALGATLFAFALSFQIKANHPQITYYLAIVVFSYAIGRFIHLCIDKDRRGLLKNFFIASALLLVIGVTGIATNANKLIPTLKYTPYTMRGGSELTSDKAGHNNSGLDLEYATAWSYGINEMPNLLIPNFNGGASSGELPLDSETGTLLKRAGQPNLRQTMKHLPLYWGPQPFTAGPMYLGAVSIFLFIIGLIICRGREKWWLAAASLIAVLLAWGSHFMWFTKLWFEYAPMYNKFRTVSMALTVLQTTVPLLGFYAIDRIFKEKYDKGAVRKAGFIAYGITAGFCLLCALIPSVAGTFTGSSDSGINEIIVEALAADRATLLKKDAIRSFVLISCVFALLLWVFRTPAADAVGKNGSFVLKGRSVMAAAALIFIVWFDLAGVGKRYLNKEHFVTPADFTSHYEPRPADEAIFMDEDPDYRVLDLSVNTFNDAIQSYHHKCIGGYSPVKLQRYQDLIDRYIVPEIHEFYKMAGGAATIQEIEDNLSELKVISMLNGRYIIVDPNCSPVYNSYAYGNCWFVDDFVPAATPDEEIALIASTDLHDAAVIGDDFKWAQDAFQTLGSDDTDTIELTRYAPNELRYSFSTSSPRAAVFSEIYYPEGWKAWIEPAGTYGNVSNGRYNPTADAVAVDLFRADWMLRGVILPEGEGELIMRFEPESYRIGEDISRASSILLLIILSISAAGILLERRIRKS